MNSSERNLVLALVAALMLVTGLWLALRPPGPEGGGPLEKVEARWSFAPVWEEGPAVAPAGLSGDGGRLDIYVDSSLPMGGFLSREADGPGSAFEAVLRSAPDHLLRIDGGASSRVAFFGVAEDLEAAAGHRALESRFYRGGQSRLDKALAEIGRTLSSGETEAALVLTDLIATGEVVGAQGAAQTLRGFLRSAEVRSGKLHLGLLGVKDSYRGVRPSGCAAPAGKPGCRFSEQRQKWIPLEENAVVPFYVLVFARGREPVEQVLAGFAEELAELDFEVESELLSGASEARAPVSTECSVHTKANPGRRQYGLFSDRDGLFRCARSEEVLLSCLLPPEPRPLEAGSARAETWLAYSLQGENLEVALDCGAIRDRDFPVEIRFSARREGKDSEKWSDWSSTSDDRPGDVGRTLRLKEFLDKARLAPGSYDVAVTLWPRGSAK